MMCLQSQFMMTEGKTSQSLWANKSYDLGTDKFAFWAVGNQHIYVLARVLLRWALSPLMVENMVLLFGWVGVLGLLRAVYSGDDVSISTNLAAVELLFHPYAETVVSGRQIRRLRLSWSQFDYSLTWNAESSSDQDRGFGGASWLLGCLVVAREDLGRLPE